MSVDVHFSEDPALVMPFQKKHILTQLHVTDDFIFYVDDDRSGRKEAWSLIRMNHDGSDPMALLDKIGGEIKYIAIAGEWIVVDVGSITHFIRPDGSGEHRMGEPFTPEGLRGTADSAGLWQYDLLEDGSAVILGSGSKLRLSGKLPIANKVDKKPVTALGEKAFALCESLESVVIPKGVTSIGDYAFQWCGALTEVTIPEGVTHIGEGAFWGCSNLKKVTLPASLVSIGRQAFEGCDSLSLSVTKKNVTFAVVDGVLVDLARNVPVE